MRHIPLTNGGFAIVDDEWFEPLMRFSWQKSPQGYASRCTTSKGRQTTHLMHRVICGASAGMLVDHENQNGLDNRAANLRLASHSQNHANSGINANNSSGFRGVFFDKQTGRYRVKITKLGKPLYFGRFVRIEDAVKVHAREFVRLFGSFANIGAA